MSTMSFLLAQQGSLFVLLYAPITASTFASCTLALNAGKYVSRKSFSDTTALKLCLSASGPECTAKCFAQAAVFMYFLSSPCMPFINATAMREVRYGSSPYVSWPLPQRGSRKIFIFGLQKVSPKYILWLFSLNAWWCFARASSDMAVDTSSIRLLSKVAA